MFYYTPKFFPNKSLRSCKVGEKAIGRDGSTYIVNLITDNKINKNKKVWLKTRPIIDDSDSESESES